MSKEIIQKIEEQPKRVHHINGLEVIIKKIGSMAVFTLGMRITNPKLAELIAESKGLSAAELEENLENFESGWNEIFPKFESEIKNKTKDMNLPNKEQLLEMVLSIFKSLPASRVLFVTPEEFVKKLATLSIV